LGNVIFDLNSPHLAAVVDWELATLGDPNVDLGHLLCTWPDDSDPGFFDLESWDGLPTQQDLVAHYAERARRSVEHVGWYETLACYRLAIIIEGTHVRAMVGEATAEVGERLHRNAVALVRRAQRRIAATLSR
jgi:aminoglycoside phosphotransferase (APT) family kinase protein